MTRNNQDLQKQIGWLNGFCHLFKADIFSLGDASTAMTTRDFFKGNLVQTSISEYDLGGEGDLFKAPEPIIKEPVVSLDPLTAAISIISCGEDVMSTQGLKVADIESLQDEQLLSEVFYECRKDQYINTKLHVLMHPFITLSHN